MKKQGLTARQVQYMKPDPNRRLEVPAGRGLYLVVHPTGKKTWAFRYRWNDGHKKLTFAESYPDMGLAAARAEAERAHTDLKNNIDPAAEIEDSNSGPETLQEVTREFLTRRVAGTKTLGEVDRVLRVYVLPAWKHRLRIDDVSRADVLRVVDAITDKGNPVMANRTLSAMKRLFSWCVERGYVETSPAVGIKPNRERSRDRVLSPEELVEVWKASDQLGYPLGPFFKVLLLTAQRRGEVAAARWQDLDLESGLWTMEAEKMKSGRIHDVPLSGPVLDILHTLARFEGGDYVFTTTGGHRPISGFSKAKTRLGKVILSTRRESDPDAEQMPRWTVHDLRRTAATHMAEANVPPHVLAAILGHFPGRTMGISAIYIRHQYFEERRQALEQWAAHVLDLVTSEKVKAAGDYAEKETALGYMARNAGEPCPARAVTTAGTAKGAGLKKKKFSFNFKERPGKSVIEMVIPVTADLDNFARRRNQAETALKRLKSGTARARDLRNATERRNQKRKRKAGPKHEKWRSEARQVWAKHPGLSASSVARKIAGQDDSPDYVRQIIATENPSKKS